MERVVGNSASSSEVKSVQNLKAFFIFKESPNSSLNEW